MWVHLVDVVDLLSVHHVEVDANTANLLRVHLVDLVDVFDLVLVHLVYVYLDTEGRIVVHPGIFFVLA